MILIDGKKAAAELREELKQEVSQLKSKYSKVPGLTVILIGDLTPSQIYVRNKEKSANEVGLKSEVIRYPDSVEEKTVLDKIIHHDQKGFVVERYIGEAGRGTFDILSFAKEQNVPGLLLQIDFEKAYDSISFSIIKKSLKTISNDR